MAQYLRQDLRKPSRHLVATLTLLLLALTTIAQAESELQSCIETAKRGLLDVPDDRSKRFLGKVQEDTARCRGGEKAVQYRDRPWVDWQNYYATGDASKEGRARGSDHARRTPVPERPRY